MTSMSTPTYSPTVNELFFQPLEQAIATAWNLWPCPEFPDDVWIHMGVQRVLEARNTVCDSRIRPAIIITLLL